MLLLDVHDLVGVCAATNQLCVDVRANHTTQHHQGCQENHYCHGNCLNKVIISGQPVLPCIITLQRLDWKGPDDSIGDDWAQDGNGHTAIG